MTIISDEPCFLLGVNCISGQEKNSIHEEWERRYSPFKAFLVDANNDDDAIRIVEKLCDCIKAKEITTMAGNACVLAFFLDLSSQTNVNIDAINAVASKLSTFLHVSIALTLQFGYIGLVGLGDSRPIRSLIQTVIQKNESIQNRTQLILVAKPALATLTYSIWLPPIVFLDFLRRHSNPVEKLPMTGDGYTNNDVGFLSYREFNEKVYNNLLKQSKQLQDALGTGGKENFSTYVSKNVDELAAKIDKQMIVDGNKQPQHPDMIVPPNRQKKAGKGQYDPYVVAAALTEEALQKTGESLMRAVKDGFALTQQQADSYLQRMMKDSGLGLEAASDKEAISLCLRPNYLSVEKPITPKLKYDANGCIGIIEDYLRKCKSYAIYQGKTEYLRALLAAYERIPAEYYQTERNTSTNKLKEVTAKLNGQYSAEEFFSRAVNGQLSLTGMLFAEGIAAAVSKTYFLLRGAEATKMAENSKGALTGYSIDEKEGGIQQLDDSPMKLLRLTLLDCSEENLAVLIKGD